jgi:hypothetical protein
LQAGEFGFFPPRLALRKKMPRAAGDQQQRSSGNALAPMVTQRPQHDADNAKDNLNGSFTGAAWHFVIVTGW